VRLLAEEAPDLVVTDLIMPEQEGIETIAQIREASGVPIIAISGSGKAGDFAPLLDAELMGADITLAKPFTPEALLGAVEELLRSDPAA
jgi:DNA-binding response OmpR family regulator